MADNLGVNKTSYSSPEEGIDFPTQAKKIVEDAIKDGMEKARSKGVELDPIYDDFETYVVWFAFVLGSWKALVSTSVNDGCYYEVTFNKAESEAYVDVYEKITQVVI